MDLCTYCMTVYTVRSCQNRRTSRPAVWKRPCSMCLEVTEGMSVNQRLKDGLGSLVYMTRVMARVAFMLSSMSSMMSLLSADVWMKDPGLVLLGMETPVFSDSSICTRAKVVSNLSSSSYYIACPSLLNMVTNFLDPGRCQTHCQTHFGLSPGYYQVLYITRYVRLSVASSTMALCSS